MELHVMGESFVFCLMWLDPRLNSQKRFLDSRFLMRAGIENRVENRDSQQTVNLLLNGTPWYMYKDLVDF